MNKERIKSLVLACLVIINFLLGAKLLTDKKLWPYGYNFFVSLENSEFFKAFTSSQDKKSARTHIVMPEQIIVNTGDQTSRIAINPDTEIFAEIYNISHDILSRALESESKNIFFAPKEEWVSVLNGKSVCFIYAVSYDTLLFGDFYNTDSNALFSVLPSFSRVIISTSGAVYFENAQTGDFYKATASKDSEELLSIINKAKNTHRENTSIINYSVDLKFDEAFGSQKTVLSPTVPIYSSPVKMPILAVANPVLTAEGTFNNSTIEKILSIFDVNSNTVRRYSEIDGTLVFVENDGILKISPDGLLRYQSTTSEGFNLSSGTSYTNTISALTEVAGEITKICSLENSLFVSCDLNNTNQTITFDYRAGGVPVITSYKDYSHAITAEINNGSMTSYTQILRSYVPSATLYEIPAYINTLDEIIERYSVDMNNIEIQKMFIAYKDDGSMASKQANWEAKIKSIVIEN